MISSNRPRRLHLVLAILIQCLSLAPSASASPLQPRDVSSISSSAHLSPSWYDWGWYGVFPRRSFESFGAKAPLPLMAKTSAKCEDGYIFMGPRGAYVDTPGPIALDKSGELMWMDTQWGEALNVKVQQYQGKKYITFWHGVDNGTFGDGFYLMLDESYQVFKKVFPAGNHSGDLHEFRITADDTALMTIYEEIPADMSSAGGPREGWIYDSIFQEMDLATGKLLFEWRASDHFSVSDSLAPRDGDGSFGNGDGSHPSRALDFFHINSVDKNAAGDYIISSRFMCAVAAISGRDGRVLWQLGGLKNSFHDLSDGAATDLAWNHHAQWVVDGRDKDGRDVKGGSNLTAVTVFDNAANGQSKPAARASRGLRISLNLEYMTATLERSYGSPQDARAISQGSVQVLPEGNVLVGWGHVPSYTEFSRDGEVLCDTHFGPLNLDRFGWVKNYRTFKHTWVGRPKTPPAIAMRPKQQAVFVSWNGATEVARWALQSSDRKDVRDEAAWKHHDIKAKTTFETEFRLPGNCRAYVRVVALDANDNVLGTSRAVSRDEYTVVEAMATPQAEGRSSRSFGLLQPIRMVCLALICAIIGVAASHCFKTAVRCGVKKLLRSTSFHYQTLPAHEGPASFSYKEGRLSF